MHTLKGNLKVTETDKLRFLFTSAHKTNSYYLEKNILYTLTM